MENSMWRYPSYAWLWCSQQHPSQLKRIGQSSGQVGRSYKHIRLTICQDMKISLQKKIIIPTDGPDYAMLMSSSWRIAIIPPKSFLAISGEWMWPKPKFQNAVLLGLGYLLIFLLKKKLYFPFCEQLLHTEKCSISFVFDYCDMELHIV